MRWLVAAFSVVLSFVFVPSAGATNVLVAGQQYETGGGTCSLGFPISGGFLTAGHCGGVGQVVSVNGRRFGVVSKSVGNATSGEYAVISVDPGWMIKPTGMRVAPPRVGRVACKRGVPMWSSGPVVSCGLVTSLAALDGCSTIGMFYGDSGGIVFSGREAWGLVSRPFGPCGVMVFTRLDKLGYHIL